ncbi:PAS domain-containing hybrid sensor histidine kinase/response regulator [Gemmatimonas sp.]
MSQESHGAELRKLDWQELFEIAPRAMWVYDLETLQFLAVNDAAVATYGWSRTEFLAMDLRAIRPVEDVGSVEKSVATTREAFARSTGWRHRWKDGSLREVEIASHELTWEGRPARLVLVDDVTVRREAEQTLLAMNDQLRKQAALLDLATDAIVVCELDGRVSFWNGGAARNFGWQAGDVLGRAFAEVLLLEHVAFAEAFRTATTAESGAWRGEWRGTTRAEDEVVLSVSLSVVRDSHQAPYAVLAILTDITAQRKLEAQFLRAQRLESIGTLAGGIAHDLNNMLAPIVMSIQLLADEVTSDEGRELLRTIEGSARRGADLVQQVLSFARGVEGERLSVALADLVRDIERLLHDTLPRHIVLDVDVPLDLPPVRGDATQLHQVLLNLCVNARDAMPAGGQLRVVARAITLDAHYAVMVPDGIEGPFLCIDVSDTGIGIPPAMLDRIFDPFFTTKPFGQGTGLGLATVQAIVRSHGGFVNVYSEAGKGTTFRVYLPQLTGAASELVAKAPVAEMPRGHGELVLVVDDEAAIRAITRQTLEAYGYRVLLAADGEEALSLFGVHADAVALVLTDMMMPRLDGPGLIAALLHRAPHTRILAVSGLGANGGVAKAVGLGVTNFLAKPFTADTLLNTIAAVLQRDAQA